MKSPGTVAMLLVAGLLGALGSAHAEVPTAEHMAVCNGEAQEGVRGSSTSST